jgi:hypothetical protein
MPQYQKKVLQLFDLNPKSLNRIKDRLKDARSLDLFEHEETHVKKRRVKPKVYKEYSYIPAVVEAIEVCQAELARKHKLSKLDEKSRRALKAKFDKVLD